MILSKYQPFSVLFSKPKLFVFTCDIDKLHVWIIKMCVFLKLEFLVYNSLRLISFPKTNQWWTLNWWFISYNSMCFKNCYTILCDFFILTIASTCILSNPAWSAWTGGGYMNWAVLNWNKTRRKILCNLYICHLFFT